MKSTFENTHLAQKESTIRILSVQMNVLMEFIRRSVMNWYVVDK